MRASVFCILLLAAQWRAKACQCGSVPAPDAALPSVDAVFAGVVAARTPVLHDFAGHLVPVERVQFIVLDTWRGSATPRITLLQGLSDCSSRFRVGESYLIFARRERDSGASLTSSICLPTQPLASAGTALASLRAPMRSFPLPPMPKEHRLQLLIRHGRASLLCGLALLRGHVRVLSYSHGAFTPTFLLAPLALLLAAGVLVAMLLTGRRRLTPYLIPPLAVFISLSIVVEGYLYIRSSPLLWYLLDRT